MYPCCTVVCRDKNDRQDQCHIAICDNRYLVIFGDQCHVAMCDENDKLLRQADFEQLKEFIHAGGRIEANKLEGGGYVLRSYVPDKRRICLEVTKFGVTVGSIIGLLAILIARI